MVEQSVVCAYTGRRESRQRYLDIFNTIKILASEHKWQLWLFVKTLFPDNKIMSALRKNKMILHQLDYYTIILSQITHLRSLVAQQMTRPANTQFLNILNILHMLVKRRHCRCERNVAKRAYFKYC